MVTKKVPELELIPVRCESFDIYYDIKNNGFIAVAKFNGSKIAFIEVKD